VIGLGTVLREWPKLVTQSIYPLFAHANATRHHFSLNFWSAVFLINLGIDVAALWQTPPAFIKVKISTSSK
jgi:hypothetical protein